MADHPSHSSCHGGWPQAQKLLGGSDAVTCTSQQRRWTFSRRPLKDPNR